MATKNRNNKDGLSSALEDHFMQMESDLQYVAKKLELEFYKNGSGQNNPIQISQQIAALVEDINKAKTELLILRAAKQDHIESCASLMTSRRTLERIQQLSDMNDLENEYSAAVTEELTQMCKVWNKQAGNREGFELHV